MKILNLNLEKKWFDMIAAGVKREEYRAITAYWTRRLFQLKKFDFVQFRNGYQPNSPIVLVELLWIDTGFGKPEWGAPAGRRVYVLTLGDLVRGGRYPRGGPDRPDGERDAMIHPTRTGGAKNP